MKAASTYQEQWQKQYSVLYVNIFIWFIARNIIDGTIIDQTT